jgi:hypothetical protein
VEKPVLAILAAGIGNRYGGLKQIAPVGPGGELIIDYSIYDAIKAGFEKVVCIITRELESDFREVIGDRVAKYVKVDYAYQEPDCLPLGYHVPQGRTRPWGTTHALLCAKDLLQGPFAVINADDYYGPSAFETIYGWLIARRPGGGKPRFAMVAYLIENTVPDTGRVTRGICEADGRGFLASIAERKMVEKTPSGARFSEDGGATWIDVPAGTLVSMNFWGLDESFLAESERDFPLFLDENLSTNSMKCEFLLPLEVGALVHGGRAEVEVLRSGDAWFGITYKEDRSVVAGAIAAMHEKKAYPTPLWR